MKKILIIVLLFTCTLLLYSQEVAQLDKESIIGRWIEVKDPKQNNAASQAEHYYTYIFRDNMIFHLGEAHEGVILFNITGKYSLEENSIDVVYSDLINGNSNNREAKHIKFKILSWKKNEMTLSAMDYDYEHIINLKKVDFGK